MSGAPAPASRSRPTALPAGVGLGLRWEFLEEVTSGEAIDVAFFEVSPENYMNRGGYYPAALEQVLERYAIVSHGLTLSLGSEKEPDPGFVDALGVELRRLKTPWHSDHLSFSFAGERMLHELLPLRFDRETARRVADRLRRLEDELGLPMVVENVTYYCHPGRREMSEPEFIAEVLERSGARLLLDVNNVYVNAQNHGFDALEFLTQLPLERVVELHVAGHTPSKWGVLIDSHGAPVIEPVHALLGWVLERTGPLPVLLERDNHVPELPELVAEVKVLQGIYDAALAAREAGLAARA
jgi:uncharacterized protein (UPF0276 family)